MESEGAMNAPRNHVAVAVLTGVVIVLGMAEQSVAATLLFSDNFESGNASKWDLGCTDPGTGVTTTNPHQGTYSMKCETANYQVNFAGLNQPTVLRSYQVFWSYLPTGYSYGPDGHGHWFRNFSVNWTHTLDVELYPDYIKPIFFWRNGSGTHIETMYFSSPVIHADSRWHKVEMFYQLNTPGQADGFFKMWFDGQLVLNEVNAQMRPPTVLNQDGALGDLTLPSNMGNEGQPGYYEYVDDVEVWTDCPATTLYSGTPTCAGGTSDTPPSTPTMNAPSVISSSQINLAWIASTDQESSISSYNLYRCQGSSTCPPSLLTNVGNVTAYANTGLTGNTLYRYQVSAVNGAGLEGGKSTIQTATTPGASAFDFALSHGGNRSVPQGSSVTNSITATLAPGASAQSVAFSVSSTLPSGTTASFSPTSCLPDCLSTLTLTTSGTTPTGTWDITVTATGGSLTRTTSFPLTVQAPIAGGGIAARYPQDVGIETDPQVVFVERFDDSLTNVSARWSETKNSGNMTLDADVPVGSPSGSRSLRIAGASEGGHLYKNLAAAGLAQHDVLYVRYYTKHPLPSNFAHSGVWMGGYYPPTDWPQGGAGTRPVGNDRFVAGAEVIDKSTGWFDHYDYWMGMHSDPSGSYWGNDLLNDQTIRVGNNQWVCVEHMVKLNNPVSSLNGEHAIWLNGTKISHLGQAFPTGSWVWDSFIQDPSVTTTFEGFQWRNDPNLTINWLWLENFTPSDPSVTLKFDHVVAATAYIGCLATSPTCLRGDLDCSGKVDLDDLRRMIYMLIGTVPVDLAKADLDGDGQLTLADLQALVRILVGIP